MTFKVKDGLSVSGNIILDAAGNLTLPAGSKATLSNTTTAGASLNLGTGTADPTTPATGDLWNNSGILKIRQSAATKTVAFLDSTITGNAANVTGTVAVANGGTNGTAVPTLGGAAYGDGSAYAFTAAGSAGQILTSNGAGAPTWQTLSSTSTNATFVAITDDVATATSQYLYFGSAVSGNASVKGSSSRLTFVPSTGNLSTIGSVTVGGNGVVYNGSTSGSATIKATAIAGTGTIITLPATTGTVVTTGDTGTVTSAMIAGTTIVNANISAAAAIAVSKLATPTISGVTLGSNLFSLTLGTGLVGGTYNGSAAVTTGLAASGVVAATYGSSTSIPVIAVDATGRITTASNSAITIGTGTLGAAAAANTGATATTVALNFSAAYDANTASNVTINPVIGPALSALATIMTGASVGILSKTAADTYAFSTNSPTATKLASATTIQGISFDGSAAITPVSAGTGVSFSGTAGTTQAINIGQAVATSSNVQFQALGVGVSNTVAGTIAATSFNSITGLSSTTPLVASGAGAVGTGVTVARADHTHPVQATITGNAGTVTDGAYLSATNTFTGTNAFNGTGSHTFGNVNGVYTGYIQLGGRGIRKLTTGSSIQIVDSTNTTATHTFGDAGTFNCTGALTGSSFNSITGLSSTAPLIAGTATVGTATLVAREDHVHPVQTTVSGNAGTATILATARNINGVSFDGSADITVADGTKLPLAGGTITGQLTLSGFAPIINFIETDQTAPYVNRRRLVLDGNLFSLRRNTATDGSFSTESSDFISDTSGNFTAAGNVTAYSDIRLKKDLVQIPNALDKVQQLTGYTYTRIDSGEKQTGLVAQDVQKVLPEAVLDGEHLSVAYGNLVGLLVEAIKELRAEVEALKGSK